MQKGTLMSFIPEHECPMLVLGDMNIHLDNLNSADFQSLVHLIDLQQVPTPPTHKVGKELDVNLMVSPLHLSDHFFILFNVLIDEQPSASPPTVSLHGNLCNLSPTHSSLVSSALPPFTSFSFLGLIMPQNLSAPL